MDDSTQHVIPVPPCSRCDEPDVTRETGHQFYEVDPNTGAMTEILYCAKHLTMRIHGEPFEEEQPRARSGRKKG